MNAVMARVREEERQAQGGDAGSSKRHGYVPPFLRSKRTSLAPKERGGPAVEHMQWVVPQMTANGYEMGLFDEEMGIAFFE
jgi:hypothetical protein